MMKIISSLYGWLSAPAVTRDYGSAEWLCDPLAHPAIDAMSQREIADLPLRRTRHAPGRLSC